MQRTAEFVTPKHPDKMCDRIADAILDECLSQDPNSRCAIEVMGGHGIVTVTGEITSSAFVDIPKIVHRIAGNIGVNVNLVKQSPEIAQGVDVGGAGDQGIMVGYACDENEEMVPQEYFLARNLCKFLYNHYEADGKTQVTIDDGKIVAVVASFCGFPTPELKRMVREWVKLQQPEDTSVVYHINPAGEWDVGGFDADTGLTGRKLVVDCYGPRVAMGGGAFSGKDPTKVDRSGAYAARGIAQRMVKSYPAKEVYVYLAYAIGVPEPVQATIIVDGKEVDGSIAKNLLLPQEIIKGYSLKRPIYEVTAGWGHFGNGFAWDL